MGTSRRDFLKILLPGACALAVLGTATLTSCSGIRSVSVPGEQGVARVPLTEFAEDSLRILRVKGMDYDILLVKKAADRYEALQMRCTHEDFGLNAISTGLNCPAHGSSFDLNGNVTNGPAARPLKKYRAEISGPDLAVYINS